MMIHDNRLLRGIAKSDPERVVLCVDGAANQREESTAKAVFLPVLMFVVSIFYAGEEKTGDAEAEQVLGK